MFPDNVFIQIDETSKEIFIQNYKELMRVLSEPEKDKIKDMLIHLLSINIDLLVDTDSNKLYTDKEQIKKLSIDELFTLYNKYNENFRYTQEVFEEGGIYESSPKERVIRRICNKLELSYDICDNKLKEIEYNILNNIYRYIQNDELTSVNGKFIKSIITYDNYREYLEKFNEFNYDLNYDLDKLKEYIQQQSGGNKKIKKKIIKRMKIYKQKK